jgi:hypothetical protein
MRTYNLFRRTDLPELVCAVPEARRVPAFISAPRWEFAGRVQDSETGFSSFNHEAAAASVVYNGFYLFQLVEPREFQLPANGDAVEASFSAVSQVAHLQEHDVAVIGASR